MIDPFENTKLVIHGSSAGLSAASYDIRIAHDLTLGPNPMAVLHQMMMASASGAQAMEHVQEMIKARPLHLGLAYSLETFAIPHDVVAYVVDKSTYARRFMSAFNTLFDPGFVGAATLELVNLGPESIIIHAGDPICQVAFHFLDQPTDRPYQGKYNHQPARAVGARAEREDGTFIEAGVYPGP